LEHLNVITDLATVTLCAGTVAIIFHYLRLPLMLGYILSGFLIGPNLFSFSLIHNQAVIQELSELGVVFLMFYIGLEFDLSKLKKSLGSSLMGVLLQCIAMIFIGMLLAPILGWSSINGLFLGGLLAISSTMVAVSILKEQKAFDHTYGQIAISMLILEDIVAILMLVILTGIAVTGRFAWGTVWQVTFFVGVFVVGVFFTGRLLAPYLVKILEQTKSVEMLAVTTVGAVLGIGQLAEKFHFSIALGAFLAGSIFSGSSLTKSIEATTDPLRHLFTAIFFVSVGMVIQPDLLKAYWKIIVILTFTVFFFKTLTCWLGIFLSGVKSRASFKAAVCKAQIGEFSFVIAALAKSLGVAEPGLMAVAVGVSLGTIVIVPFLSNRAAIIYDKIEKRTPPTIIQIGYFYHNVLKMIKTQLGENALLRLIKGPFLQVVASFLIFHGIILVASLVANHMRSYSILEHYSVWPQIGVWVITAIVCLPFLIAVIRNIDVCIMLITEAALSTRESFYFISGRMRNIFNTLILGVTLLLFSGSYLSVASSYFPSGLSLLLFILLLLAVTIFFWKHIIHINSRIEHLFIESFNQEVKSNETVKQKAALEDILKKYPWPVNLKEVLITPDSTACGKQISDLDLRHQTGGSIIALRRSGYTYYNPGPEIPLFPADELILLGNANQNQAAEALLCQKLSKGQTTPFSKDFRIEQVFLGREATVVGETLASLDLRKQFGINVIGIQRADTRITAPAPDETLIENDLLMIVGNPGAVSHFKHIIKAS
jgi:CPA2 family monovalent cation:H+ antiporter-2